MKNYTVTISGIGTMDEVRETLTQLATAFEFFCDEESGVQSFKSFIQDEGKITAHIIQVGEIEYLKPVTASNRIETSGNN
jgi:hypothetical protein